MSKTKKAVIVTAACLLVLVLPITASAATLSTTLSVRSEFGYQLTKSVVYTPQGDSFLPGQVYVNSYGDMDLITFTLPKTAKGDYYFAFSFKTLEDNYNAIQFDVEVSDRLYTGQEYNEYFSNISASNGSNSYNWFSGWVGTEQLNGKISDNEIVTNKGTPIVSKHYHIQAPSFGEKCNSYQFAFGLKIRMSGASEVTFAIKNFEFIIPEYDEKSEAQSSGSGASDDVAAAVPDKSAGFTSAIKKFVACMSTTETECNLKLPSVIVPEIDGLFSESSLIKEQDINFNQAISLIPSDIMDVVHALTTIGLIIFCFKELYNTIEYVLTMRKGGNNE